MPPCAPPGCARPADTLPSSKWRSPMPDADQARSECSALPNSRLNPNVHRNRQALLSWSRQIQELRTTPAPKPPVPEETPDHHVHKHEVQATRDRPRGGFHTTRTGSGRCSISSLRSANGSTRGSLSRRVGTETFSRRRLSVASRWSPCGRGGRSFGGSGRPTRARVPLRHRTP